MDVFNDTDICNLDGDCLGLLWEGYCVEYSTDQYFGCLKGGGGWRRSNTVMFYTTEFCVEEECNVRGRRVKSFVAVVYTSQQLYMSKLKFISFVCPRSRAA